MSEVLIVEDQPAVAKALHVLLEIHDIPCRTATSPEEALETLRGQAVAVVIQDMNFTPGVTSGREGVELFRRMRAVDPELPVIVITAWTSLDTAVQMVKEGASDYVAKPWDDAKLVASVRTLLDMRRQRASAAPARAGLPAADLRGLVFTSAGMRRVVNLAVRVAGADVPVLITGPNGAGKEKIAEIVQANSRRRQGPFVKVNVGALPDELLESELFGAEQGAFTGAVRRRLGRFESADGGTLFLDEIGNLSAAGQMKVLRVLQSGEFERLGSSETRKVDVRVLAATNVDLRQALATGRFREDLFFRLNVIELRVPSLHERPEDILPLAESFLRASAAGSGAPRTLSPDARTALLAYEWPGNVRELMNRIQRATLVAPTPQIGPEDLGLTAGPELRRTGAEGGLSPAGTDGGLSPAGTDGGLSPAGTDGGLSPAGTDGGDEAERDALERLLLDSGGSVSRAAARLGISRQALYRRMDRLGIVLERRPRAPAPE